MADDVSFAKYTNATSFFKIFFVNIRLYQRHCVLLHFMNKAERLKLTKALIIPLMITAIVWITWILDKTENLKLYEWGIFPRQLSGLKGILFTPFLHDTKDSAHIVNNSFPWLFLSWSLYYFYEEIASRILVLIWLLTGLWVWIGANEAYHVGISGILYGLVTFLFYSGIIRKNKHLMGLTLLVTFFYGGMVWGVLPYDISISWESHLFGAIAGIILAWYFRKSGPAPDYKEWPEEKEPPFLLQEDGTKDYDYWKTEEQRLKDEKNDELKINYIYKEEGKEE